MFSTFRRKPRKADSSPEEAHSSRGQGQKAEEMKQSNNKWYIEDFTQGETNKIPIFIRKCVRFIEKDGLKSEGIFRAPGDQAHVDLFFQKFEEEETVDIRSLHIDVDDVATALKTFVRRLPPLIPKERIAELGDFPDQNGKLFALRSMLKKINPDNFDILKLIFQHFVKIAENCQDNCMNSKSLAICWWPTLIPMEFKDLNQFEKMRAYLEDVVQTMIDHYPVLFCEEEAITVAQ